MYASDHGLEELARRRGGEQVSLAWLAEQLRTYLDLHPGDEDAVNRMTSWLARADDEDE
jgi:hypothetical protein